jgi:ribonuclease HI
MAKKNFYAVIAGKKTGIFKTWKETEVSVLGFNGAQYKGFVNLTEAEDYMLSNGVKAEISKEVIVNSNCNTIENSSSEIKIFCDGSSIPNPGKTGSGVCVYRGNKVIKAYYGGHEVEGTNNTAEILAFNFALKLVHKSSKENPLIEIHIDSAYTINAITKWAKGWSKNGWIKSDGKEVKNRKIIEETFNLYEMYKNVVDIKKVKAHVGIEGNEIADRLANYARIKESVKFKVFDINKVSQLLIVKDVGIL